MEFALLGWPADGPTLRLDYRRFSYAGKFVMSNTGKAVVRADDADSLDRPPVDADAPVPDPSAFEEGVLAALAFNEDRTDPGVCWFRYVTVAEDRRGEGWGPRLAAFVAEHAERRGYRRLRIAVNNAFAYHAMYKAGFVYTGRETGMAELVLERPGQRDRATYQCGLDVFRERDLGEPETAFLDEREGGDPPTLVEAPPGDDESESNSATGDDASPSSVSDVS